MVSGPGRENGVVVSGHCLASEAGAAVLKDGGNAVDAAVAAALVLTVVAPYATSLGGDVYMLVFEPGSGEVHGLNGTGRAPARAVRAAFGDDIPPSGFASVSVPGFLAGIAAALDRLGTRPLAALIGPARDLAADGFAAHATLARNVAARKDLLARDPEAAALFLPHGVPLAEGALLRQRDLAVVFDTIAREGPGGFYSGVAERIVADCEARGGLLGIADFASCAPLWQAPMSAPFFGHDVVTMPPNSYGMTLLFQLVDLAEQGARSLEPDDAAFLGAAIAARRRAYREARGLIADPDLVEDAARARLARLLGAGRLAGDGGAAAAEARDTDTTNVVAIDREGRAVSLIQSISAPFGAGVVASGTGVVLNNRMRGFVIDPGSPNCVGPAKRPAHTLSPCLVLKDGKAAMAVGTPGAAGQTATLAQFLARILACSQPIAEAIAAPRASVDLKGAPIVEASIAEELLARLHDSEPELRTMPRGWQTFGSLKVATADAEGVSGYADDRREAAAVAI